MCCFGPCAQASATTCLPRPAPIASDCGASTRPPGGSAQLDDVFLHLPSRLRSAPPVDILDLPARGSRTRTRWTIHGGGGSFTSCPRRRRRRPVWRRRRVAKARDYGRAREKDLARRGMAGGLESQDSRPPRGIARGVRLLSLTSGGRIFARRMTSRIFSESVGSRSVSHFFIFYRLKTKYRACLSCSKEIKTTTKKKATILA